MKTRLILKPGQPGTKRLVERYGDSLLCVRFKYDEEKRVRLKTVELIVETADWDPSPIRARFPADSLVHLRIEATDLPMRQKAKETGARWDPKMRLWYVKYGRIAGTPLEKHIYVDGA